MSKRNLTGNVRIVGGNHSDYTITGDRIWAMYLLPDNRVAIIAQSRLKSRNKMWYAGIEYNVDTGMYSTGVYGFDSLAGAWDGLVLWTREQYPNTQYLRTVFDLNNSMLAITESCRGKFAGWFWRLTYDDNGNYFHLPSRMPGDEYVQRDLGNTHFDACNEQIYYLEQLRGSCWLNDADRAEIDGVLAHIRAEDLEPDEQMMSASAMLREAQDRIDNRVRRRRYQWMEGPL